MGKNKLAKFTELGTFNNVIQPPKGECFGIDHPVKGKWRSDIFKNQNPLIVELGCGKGEYSTGLSIRYPENNFVGVDIKGARMWRGAKTANEQNLNNVAFLRTRIEFICSFFAADEVDEIWITFPDPFPGKRNSNRRLTCPWFLNAYRNLLKNNGIIHLKTDNFELYKYTKYIVEKNYLEIVSSTTDLYTDFAGDDILSIRTHYENIFLKEGMKINYISFRLNKNTVISDGR